MPKFNDIDLKKWKEYEDIELSSLWIIENRKKNTYHSNQYHGNFVPQIPEQLIKRFTKKGELVIDFFVGGGTSIYEAYELKRRAIGVDINNDMFVDILNKINNDEKYKLIQADSTDPSTIKKIKKEMDFNEKAQLLIFHPPYHNIIKFTDMNTDLSNLKSIEEFLVEFEKVIVNSFELLENKRYAALIMGDIYQDSVWHPLGFQTMNLFIKNGYTLKSIIVKNIDETKGKRGQRSIWRYRALSSDYYLFGHEYIFIFKK